MPCPTIFSLGTTADFINLEPGESIALYPVGGTMYYGPNNLVSSSNNTGSVASGSFLNLAGDVWIVATSVIRVFAAVGAATVASVTGIADVPGLQGALDAKADASSYAALNGPTLTGAPKAPTPAADDNTTAIATTAFVLGQASSAGDGNPVMNGAAGRGASNRYARADHIHPVDTSLSPKASPTFSGTVTIPTPTTGDSSTKAASTAFVQATLVNNVVAGSVSTGTSTLDLTGRGHTVYTATLNVASHALTVANAVGGYRLVLILTQGSPICTAYQFNGVTLDVDTGSGSTSAIEAVYNGTDWVLTGVDPDLYATWIPQDHNLLGWAYDPLMASSTQLSGNTSGFYSVMKWPKTRTIGTFWWRVSTIQTAGANQIGHIYSVDGTGAATLLGSTADLTASNGTTGTKSAAMSPQSAGSLTNVFGGPGVKLALGMFTGTAGAMAMTAAPTLSNPGLVINTNMLRAFSKSFGSGTAPPSSTNLISNTGGAIASTAAPWFGVS